jgi:hypothetical protein
MSNHEIAFNTNLSEPVTTRAEFTYKITPAVISIVDTGRDKCSLTDDIEAKNRVLAPRINHKVQDHVPGWQSILERSSMGRQNCVFFALRKLTNKRPARNCQHFEKPAKSESSRRACPTGKKRCSLRPRPPVAHQLVRAIVASNRHCQAQTFQADQHIRQQSPRRPQN